MRRHSSLGLAAAVLLVLLGQTARADDRDVWRGDNVSFERVKDKQWQEKAGGDTHLYVELSKGDQFIELFDKKRNVAIRLYADHYDLKVKGKFEKKMEGKWDVAAAAGGKPKVQIAGTWRQDTAGIGLSDWYLTKNDDGTFKAVETGLGNVTGTATFKNNVLTVQFDSKDHQGFYEWKIEGKSGNGKLFFTRWPADLKDGVLGKRDGKDVRSFESSAFRLDGPEPDKLLGTWEATETKEFPVEVAVEFAKDDKLKVTVKSDPAVVREGDYRLEGTMIFVHLIKDGKDDRDTWTIKVLDGKRLAVTEGDGKAAEYAKK